MAESNNNDYPNRFGTITCEIRFYPTLEIDEEIVNLHKILRKDLPIYRKDPKLKPDKKGIREVLVHQFESKDGDLSLKLTISNLIFESNAPTHLDLFIDDILKYSKIIFEDHFKSINEVLFLGIRIIIDVNFDSLSQKLEEVVKLFEVGIDKKDLIENNIEEFSIEKHYTFNKSKFRKFIGFRKDNIINIYILRVDLDSNDRINKFHPSDLDKYIVTHKENIDSMLAEIISNDLSDVLDKKNAGD